jgi:hypothetical protein
MARVASAVKGTRACAIQRALTNYDVPPLPLVLHILATESWCELWGTPWVGRARASWCASNARSTSARHDERDRESTGCCESRRVVYCAQ